MKSRERGGKKRGGRKPGGARRGAKRPVGAGEPAEEGFRPAGLAPLNLVLLGAALVCLVVGYVLLDRGSITAAPVLLVLAYVVLIPAGLLIGSRAGRSEAGGKGRTGRPGRTGPSEKRR